MEIFFSISDHIRQVTGNKFRLRRHRPLGGGCINRSGVLEGDGLMYFVKLNRSSKLYNLYHVLNHFNLFGGGYAAQAGLMIDALLASPPV